MDVTVRYVNNRLALQVPRALPLGLVFVSGKVCALQSANKNSAYLSMQLEEGGHRIHCLVLPYAVDETDLVVGQHVRAGGHLSFEPKMARYILIVRDVETEESAATPTTPEITIPYLEPEPNGVHGSHGGRLQKGKMPAWVKELAPPEIKNQNGNSSMNAGKLTQKTFPGNQNVKLDETTLEKINIAMDNHQDVELTTILAEDAGLASAKKLESERLIMLTRQQRLKEKRKSMPGSVTSHSLRLTKTPIVLITLLLIALAWIAGMMVAFLGG